MNCKSSGSLGDIIYSLPCVLAHGGGHLFLEPDVPGNYYEGCISPHGSSRMTCRAAEWLLPLLNYQQGIRAAIWQHDRAIDINLDEFRWTGVSHTWGHIPVSYAFAHPFYFDFTLPWLTVPPVTKSTAIVVNVTSRYSGNLSYDFLQDYPHVLFVGLESEYQDFVKTVPQAVWIRTDNALLLAKVIASSAMFIGRQSCAFAITEALKVPRVLEICQWAANVIPAGGLCYNCINQKGFVWSVKDCYARATKIVESGH